MQIKYRLAFGFVCCAAAFWFGVTVEHNADHPEKTLFAIQQVKAQDKVAPKAVDKNPPKGMEELRKDAKAFRRGAVPTPKAKIFAAKKFSPTGIRALSQVAFVPKKMDVWGNASYGDCVSAEEAFNQAACGVFIDASVVVAWAQKNGYLNGANLTDVMDSMSKSGFSSGGHTYGDGPYSAVDYSNETTLKAAIALSPVKIGMDANALPSGAGNQQGWYAFGGKPGQFNNEDHCTSLCGYGPAAFCFQVVGATLPSGVDPNKTCYLHFTWGTIGVVDHDWIMSTCGEAWSRNPDQTIDGTAQPNPGPSQSPPVISSPGTATVTIGASFSYQITATNTPTTFGATGLPNGVTCAAATGAITGTPTAAGTFSITMSATNAVGTGTAPLTLTVTGGPTPGPNPTPVPSNVKVPLDAGQVLDLQRDPTNTFVPTTAQVQDIINQSGLEIIDGSMTATDFFAAINRATTKKSRFKVPSPQPSATIEELKERIERQDKALIELMKRLDAEKK